MPRVMITIRDADFRGVQLILKSDRGLATLLATLSEAVTVEEVSRENDVTSITIGKEIEVSTRQLSREVRFRVRQGEVTVECDRDLLPKRPAPSRLKAGKKPLQLEFGG